MFISGRLERAKYWYAREYIKINVNIYIKEQNIGLKTRNILVVFNVQLKVRGVCLKYLYTGIPWVLSGNHHYHHQYWYCAPHFISPLCMKHLIKFSKQFEWLWIDFSQYEFPCLLSIPVPINVILIHSIGYANYIGVIHYGSLSLMLLSIPILQNAHVWWIQFIHSDDLFYVLLKISGRWRQCSKSCAYKSISISIIKFKHLKFFHIKQETNDKKVISFVDQKKKVISNNLIMTSYCCPCWSTGATDT